MCVPALMAAMGIGAGAAPVAVGGALQTIGTVVGIGGSVLQGVMGMQAANAQASAIEAQAATERQLNAVQDQRTRSRFQSQIRQQSAELAARGISLDSPAAILLGQAGAQEMSFESQSVRSAGAARQSELSAEARGARARGAESMLRGTFSAAGDFLRAAPEIWPGLSSRRIQNGRLLA